MAYITDFRFTLLSILIPISMMTSGTSGLNLNDGCSYLLGGPLYDNTGLMVWWVTS